MAEVLTHTDRSALLDEAIWAWSHTTSRPEKLRFSWCEKLFVTSIDPMAVTVETVGGELVAIRHYY